MKSNNQENYATALVTGASSGIGLELAKRFASEGYALILVARNTEALHGIARDLTQAHRVPVKVLGKDLTGENAAAEIYESLGEDAKKVSALVNNAGIATYGPFSEIPIEHQRQLLRLNVTALTELTGIFLKDMIAKGRGKILNVASTAAFQPGPLMAVYYASKAFVLSFSEALSYELKDTGITVTALCPGPTRTKFQERAAIGDIRTFKYGSMNAEKVARKGFDGLMKGKRVIIPGLLNKILAVLVSCSPHQIVLPVVKFLQEK